VSANVVTDVGISLPLDFARHLRFVKFECEPDWEGTPVTPAGNRKVLRVMSPPHMVSLLPILVVQRLDTFIIEGLIVIKRTCSMFNQINVLLIVLILEKTTAYAIFWLLNDKFLVCEVHNEVCQVRSRLFVIFSLLISSFTFNLSDFWILELLLFFCLSSFWSLLLFTHWPGHSLALDECHFGGLTMWLCLNSTFGLNCWE